MTQVCELYLWAKIKSEQQTEQFNSINQHNQLIQVNVQEDKSLLHLQTQIWDIIWLHGLANPLTSRHEVVTKDGQAEVPCQGGQGGLDAWEFLGEARGFCSKVAESTKTKDAMGMVAKYVVPAWEQVVGFN